MKIIHGLNNVDERFRGGVFTLGIFDGVHTGHQKILKKVVERAGERKAEAVVITFMPHPLEILAPKNAPPLLATIEKRMELVALSGIDICIIINFTKAFSKIKADEFVSNILVKRLRMKELVVSREITFGYKAEGDIGLLSRMSKKWEFTLVKVEPVYSGAEIISSTRIRRLIMVRKLQEAEGLLGRPYSVTGTVMRGQAIGKSLGFPTANLRPHHEVLPPQGVYCGYVLYNKKKFKALANFGFRPTFYGREKSFEIHLIDFRKDIYHKGLEFIFKYYIREERHFQTREVLVTQIETDRMKALSLLKE